MPRSVQARSVRAHTKPPRFELQSAHPAASRPAGSRLVNYPPFLCNFMLNFRHHTPPRPSTPFSHGTRASSSSPPSLPHHFLSCCSLFQGSRPLVSYFTLHLDTYPTGCVAWTSLFIRDREGDLLFLLFLSLFFSILLLLLCFLFFNNAFSCIIIIIIIL